MGRYRSGQVRMVRTSVAWQGLTTLILAMMLVVIGGRPSAADDLLDAKQLVERAQLTLEGFMADTNIPMIRDQMRDAKGVFIAPQVLKGAFVVGASGGSGVFVAREGNTTKWSGPAFYTIGSVSFGLQIGGEAAEIVLLAMTDRGVSALLGSTVKLGADVSVAAGPFGAGVGGATAALSADIISFARAKGLYAGISVDGAVVAVRGDWNKAYYGKDVSPSDILVQRTVSNPQSAGLIGAVTKASSMK